jgi:hypothetical protein
LKHGYESYKSTTGAQQLAKFRFLANKIIGPMKSLSEQAAALHQSCHWQLTAKSVEPRQ